MRDLPNPFTDSAASDAAGGYGRRTSAPLPPDATVGPFEEPSILSAPAESSTATGGIQEVPAVVPHAAAGVFVLDEAAFAAELADETVRQELAMRMPTFLSAPSQEYLRAIA